MIHVITGPPCAGKSTYVKDNAKSGELRIDYDAIAQALGAENSHAAEGIVKQAAFDAREGAIQTALKNADAESWIIHTSPSEEHMRLYEEAGADVIALDPGYDVCMERAKQDERPQQTIDGIEKWYAGKKGRISMNYKTKQFDIKSVSDTGELTGYFSTYEPVADSYGDCVAPGCFTETIKAWAEKGKHIPLVWNHNMDDPELIIGQVDKIEDNEYGPLMTAHFYDTPKAQAARNLMKEGSVYQFSYAYSIDSARKPDENEKAADPNINQVLEAVSLMEITITPTPAQPLAEMVSVKAGRRNRKSDADIIKQIISLANSLLDDEVDDTDDPDDGEDDVKANAAAEEPEQSNPEKERLLEYIKNMNMED